jgi:hypothetical protein
MCFGSKQQKVEAPAPAPAAPAPPPVEQDIGGARKSQNQQTFGSDLPDLRVRNTGLSAPSAGAGLRM